MSSVKSAVDEKWKHAKHLLTQGDFRDEEGEPQLSPSVVATDRVKHHAKVFFVGERCHLHKQSVHTHTHITKVTNNSNRKALREQ